MTEPLCYFYLFIFCVQLISSYLLQRLMTVFRVLGFLQVYLRIAVRKIHQTCKGDEWMSERFIWRDSFVRINDKSSFQQISELIPLE